MKLPANHVAGVGLHKATAYGGFGQHMLEKMGWSKGQGLGKQKHGMKEAIEVKKKEDTLGVGAANSGWKWDWKYWEDAYNTGLKSLEQRSSKKRKRQSGSSSSSSGGSSSSDSGSGTTTSSCSSSGSSSSSDSDSDSDSDSSEDEREARIAATMNRDGTAASASAAELRLAKQLAKDPWGRFGGREGKMARIRQQEEAQAAAIRAKLGLEQAPQQQAAAAKGAAVAERSSKKQRKAEAAAGQQQQQQQLKAAVAGSVGEDSSADTAVKPAGKGSKRKVKVDGGSSSSAGRKSRKGKQAGSETAEDQPEQPSGGVKKARVVIVIDKQELCAQAAAAAAFQPTPATGWWGAKMFVSAGLLEGLEQQQRERGFDEDLQTKVYMDAHNAQRQGRKGLGKSDKLKIAGGAWQGKKVTFGDADSEGEGQPGAAPVGDAAEQQGGGTAGEADAPAQKRKRSSSKADGAVVVGSSKKVKWGSLAVQQLQQVPAQQLKWKKLWPLLLAAAEQQQHQQQQQGMRVKSAVDDSCKEQAWLRLQSCSMVQVKGKVVSLSA